MYKASNNGKTISMDNIVNENGSDFTTLKNRYKAGTRVLYLCAGGEYLKWHRFILSVANLLILSGGMWMLVIIAAMQLKARIIYYSSDGKEVRGTTNEDISGLAFTLHDPGGMF